MSPAPSRMVLLNPALGSFHWSPIINVEGIIAKLRRKGGGEGGGERRGEENGEESGEEKGREWKGRKEKGRKGGRE